MSADQNPKGVPEEPKAVVEPAGTALPDKGWDLFPGAFFIIIGLGILIWARFDLGDVHSAFSFVQIVLGTAVFLYGTGTAATGNAEIPGYRVYIAGGAGALALFIGGAMAIKSEGMRDVFREQKGFAKLKFSLLMGGREARPGEFVAIVGRRDGLPLPTILTEQQVSVLLPITQKELALDRDITLQFDVIPAKGSALDAEGTKRIVCKIKFQSVTFPDSAMADVEIEYNANKLGDLQLKEMGECVDPAGRYLKISVPPPGSTQQAIAFGQDSIRVNTLPNFNNLPGVGVVPQ